MISRRCPPVKITTQNHFEVNAAELRSLHEAIHIAHARRSESPARQQEWRTACRRFHESHDRLAFPGGLARGMSLLAKGDPATIEESIRFLEADPWFFRSGYIKAEIIRHLRRAPLSPAQVGRLQQVILARVAGRDTREFRWYCRLARVVSDANFRREIERLSHSPADPIARRARWVVAQMGACPEA
jgi:hypothetical protein